MPYLKWIENIDRLLFLLINHDADHAFLDNIMIALRNPFTWIPLYIFMLYVAIKNARARWWLFALLTLVCFALTDSISASVLKPLFERPRPCIELRGMARSLVGCGGIYSMPSSHAANHFGLAAFWFWSIFVITGKKWNWLWLWAFAIGYAQIYVGKHYPSDIVVGAMLGCGIGIICARIFELLWNSGLRNPMQYMPDLP